MANFVKGRDLRAMELGIQVVRAAAVLPAQTVTTPYFTVVGGRIILTSLNGIVTAINDGQATTLRFQAVPSVGNLSFMSAVSASLINAEIGAMLSLDGVVATALQYAAANSGGVGAMTKYQVIQVGTIDALTATATAPLTARWTMTYVPYDDGAYVTST